jgi:hypothetical protein
MVGRSLVLYLVSHASGELVEMLARNAVTQLEGVEVKRRLWKMVRRLDQVPEILGVLATSPGYVCTASATATSAERSKKAAGGSEFRSSSRLSRCSVACRVRRRRSDVSHQFG